MMQSLRFSPIKTYLFPFLRASGGRHGGVGAGLACAAALLLTACASAPPQSYDDLEAQAREGVEIDVAELKQAFLDAPDYAERMEQLSTLERQALQLMEEEPLKLGPLASAILDRYYGSLAGHKALHRFYEHVDTADAAANHAHWVERITANVETDADGSKARPYRVVSASEAHAYLVVTAFEPVGSMYLTTDEVPLMMMVAAKPGDGRMRNVYFDLRDAYDAVAHSVDEQGTGDFNPGR